MFRRQCQNLTHITALCVARANAVGPVGECNTSIDSDINDNFGLSRKTMNMTRLMVLWISDEQDIAETKRCHGLDYNPSHLGYQARPRVKVPAQIKFSSGDQKSAYVLLNSIGWNSISKF